VVGGLTGIPPLFYFINILYMPYKIVKNDGGYKVTNKKTGHIYAYDTKNPKALIAAIEINKMKHNGGHKG
jgi:hypothetical protein